MNPEDPDNNAPLGEQPGDEESAHGEDSARDVTTPAASAVTSETAGVSGLPRTDDVLRKFAALGAQQAFQIDPTILERFQSTLPDLSSIALPMRDVSRWMTPELMESFRMSALKPPTFDLPESFWWSINNTSRFLKDSASIDALYPAAQLELARNTGAPSRPRASRTPEAFFSEHVAEIADVRSLLKALGAVQTKHHLHRPVWRGQQDASWAVHSSLYRRLQDSGGVDEDRLVGAEVSALAAAREWGMRTRRPVEFFAKLQHHGAPTRLLDATVDPEVAVWFAVEEHPELDDVDGLVLGWGRAPRTKDGIARTAESVPDEDGVPFWHAWTDSEQRHRVDWGTGTKTWTWFPPALNDRMRAQRAGFLLEAGPILTDDVVAVFSGSLSHDWRATEIARATSIVGLPARHDVLTKPNGANLVPLFAFRILASAKQSIRQYLERKGLGYSAVYPDLGGLVQHLRGPLGPQ